MILMHRTILSGLALTLSLLFLALCASPSTASSPLPALGERRAMWRKGNLIPDGGFEAGARGWRLGGAKITSHAPYSGSRSLRLTAHAGGRSEAMVETPVIQGLHTLSAAVRFSGIRPAAGLRVAHRFRVRITWLDARKERIRPDTLAARRHTFSVDSKPFPLLFLRSAEAIPWRRAVFVSSYDDPAYDEAPPRTAFARITFELRGPGRAEIDDVRLTYSRRNFTLLERIAPYRDLDNDRLGRVTPTPKHLEQHGDEIPIRKLCLSLPAAVPPGLEDRLRELEEKIRKLGASSVRLGSPGQESPACDLTIALTGPAPGAAAKGQDAPGRAAALGAEAYVLETRRDGNGRPIIEAAGSDARGLVYAVETLRQLLRPSPGGGAALRAVEARDWPTFRGRSLAGWEPGPSGSRVIEQASRWMVGLKLNRLYLNYSLRTSRWWETPLVYGQLVDALGRRARRTGHYDLGILVNPYAHRANPEITDTFQISRKEDVDILWAQIDGTLDAGARIIMLCMDDFTPHRDGKRYAYALTDPQDRKRFESLAHAHLELVRDLYQRLGTRREETTLMFVPPWYNAVFEEKGGRLAEEYLERLGDQIPRDVGIAWTGPTVRSRIVDAVTFERYSSSVGGRPLVLWDNSMWELELSPHYAFSPRRARDVSLFEPFAIEAEELSRGSFRGEFFLNSSSGGRYVAKAMTVAEFLWNPEAYDPDRTIWRAMVGVWGRENAALILEWDAAYWNERLWINRLAEAKGSRRQEVLSHLATARAREAERWKPLRAALQSRDAVLLAELESWKRDQEALLEKVKKASGAI
jgi:hypothetical protein